MLTRSPSPRAVAFALAFMLACFGVGLFVWKQFGGTVPLEPVGYRIEVPFAQAQNLLPNADVRISGVTVGKVVSVEPGSEQSTAVLELDSRYAPVPSDTRAILRTKTLVGETFVALSPGSRDAPPLPEGGMLPESQVQQAQQLDEVLSTFDEPTRTAFRELLQGNARALDGRAEDFNAALGNLGPTVEQLDQFLGVLDDQSQEVGTLVREAGVTFKAVDRNPRALQELMTAGDGALAVTDRLRDQLGATVAAFPSFQRNVRRTVDEAALTMREARPVLDVLRRSAPELGPGLADAESLADQLRGTLRATNPVLASARDGLPAAEQVLDSTRPLMEQLYPAGRELVPLVDLVGAYKRDLVGALSTHAAAAGDTAPDARGKPRHYVRGLSSVNNEALVALPERFGSSRFDPYPAPGALTDVGKGGRTMPSCAHVDNRTLIPPIGTGVPECRLSEPWEFRGKRRLFPDMSRAR